MSTEQEELQEFTRKVGLPGMSEDLEDDNSKIFVERALRRAGIRNLNAEVAGDTPSSSNSTGEDGDELPIIPKMWAVYGNAYSPCEKAVPKLPSSHFRIEYSETKGIYFSDKPMVLDELLVLPDSRSEEIVKGIELFWTKEKHYRAFNFIWKRGILLWGPPGSGKTSTVQIICQKIISLGGVCVYIGAPGMAIRGLESLRNIEPNRPILVIMEDIDSIIDKYGDAEVLSLLDGEFQIDNSVFIATTNYPENLDARIANRPSRFDIVKKIGMPNSEARAFYLLAKNPRLKDNQKELDSWVKASDGYSVAHLKEMIISIECLEIPFNKCVERLDSMIEDKPSSTKDPDGPKFGFA